MKKKKLYVIDSWCQCYVTLIPLPLVLREDKLEHFTLEHPSGQGPVL
jgi:hypothetical protein